MVPQALCPLCPHIFLNSVALLTMHLRTYHFMYFSANILARTMVFTRQCGRDDVLEILTDVSGLELRLAQMNTELRGKVSDMNYSEDDIQTARMATTTCSDNPGSWHTKSCVDRSTQTDMVIEKDSTKKEEIKVNTQEKHSFKPMKIVKEKDSLICSLNKKIFKLDTRARDYVRNIEELQMQLSMNYKEKIALEADITKYRERISDKDVETSNLESKAKNLEKGVKDLATKFSNKCIEKNVLERDFKKYKDFSNDIISERDNIIAKSSSSRKKLEELEAQFSRKSSELMSLEQNFKKYKIDSITITRQKDVKITNLLKQKIKNENMLVELDRKLKRHGEMYSLLRNYIVDMAVMYDDTSGKLEEALKNTFQSSEKSGVNVLCRFQELENEFVGLSRQENIFTPRLSIRKDVFKHETAHVPNLLEGADTQFSIPSKSSDRSCDPQVNWADETKLQDYMSANLKRKYADR